MIYLTDRQKRMYLIYAGIGAVVLAAGIVLTLVLVGGDSGSRRLKKERRYRCLETSREFVLSDAQVSEDDRISLSEDGPRGRATNPETGERTLVPMILCPSCEKPFVPAYYTDPRATGLTCPNCKTDVNARRAERRSR